MNENNPADRNVLDISKISINDWKNFLLNNDMITTRLENLNSNFQFIAGYYNSIDKQSDITYENLGKLNHCSVSNRNLVTDYVSTLQKYYKKLQTKFATKSFQILSCLAYSELEINAYNNGTTLTDDQKKSMTDILRGNISDEDLAKASILSAEKSPITAAIVINNVSQQDQINDFLKNLSLTGMKSGISSGYNKIWDYMLLSYGTSKATEIVVSSSGGTISAFGTSYLYDYLNDKGEWTEEDMEKAFAKAGCTAVSTFLSTVVGTALGGIPGIIASIAINYLAGPIVDLVSNEITGNVPGDGFEYNGKRYVIYKNGSGNDYHSSVYLENIDKNLPNIYYKIGNIPVSSKEVLNNYMYKDTDNFVKKAEEFNGQTWDQSSYTTHGYTYFKNKNEWDSLSEQIQTAPDITTATQYYKDFYNNSSDEMQQFMDHLERDYDMNPEEWWNTVH